MIRYVYAPMDLYLENFGTKINFHANLYWDTKDPWTDEMLELCAEKGYLVNVQVKEVYK